MATRPASSHSTRHSLKAEPGAGLTRAGLQGKEWARPPSSWGAGIHCHPNAADPRGKPDRGATAVGRGPGGRPQGAQRPTPGHAHWQAQRPRARHSVLCRGLLRPTTAHQASGRRRQLRVQPHGAMAKTTTWGALGCAEAAVCAFKARASGPAPACPRGTVPPRPRSPVRRPSFTSRGAPTRLCFLPLAAEETDEDDGRHVLCAVCHARSGVCQACARRCPACRPALSPSALTTGGRVRARFRLRHAGPESVPQHSGPRSPLSGVPLRPAWVHSAVLPRLPPRHLSGPVLLLCHL